MEHFVDLKSWFTELALNVPLTHDVRVYAIHALSKPLIDVGSSSIVISHINAKNFVDHQRVGDEALWRLTMTNDNPVAISEVGRRSYGVCHRLLRNRVHVYEELADDLPIISARIKSAILHAREVYLNHEVLT